MKKESLIYKILRKLGFIKDIEENRKLTMEMCERAIKANVCPKVCDICAWNFGCKSWRWLKIMNREILFGGKKEGKDWEVIGNIFDNPELIGETKDGKSR